MRRDNVVPAPRGFEALANDNDSRKVGFTGYARLLDDVREVAPLDISERLREIAGAPILALVVALMADCVEWRHVPQRLRVGPIAHAVCLASR